jgi:hypothetical protein
MADEWQASSFCANGAQGEAHARPVEEQPDQAENNRR